MCFRFCYFFLLLFNISASQNEFEPTEVTDADAAEAAVETMSETNIVSEMICNTCACADNIVDCTNRDIRQPFEMMDWNGLQAFKPTSVNVSYNPLRSLTQISKLPTIQYLNLSHCEIAKIDPASFSYLEALVSLDLSWNKLATTSISKRVFGGIIDPQKGTLPFEELRYLSLANNDIHSLPQDVFTFTSELTTLDLSGNPLAYIDQITMGAITELVDLKELYLSACELETLPEGMFRRQRRLRKLDLSNNRFTTVPPVLSEAVNLNYLDFGRNPIEALNQTTAFSNLTKLQELHLCRLSKLQSVSDGALGGLKSLVSLHVCFNPRLTTLDDGFLVSKDEHFELDVWPPLKEFNLNNNNLSVIHSGFLDRWDKLLKMDFSNNPYVCDCNSQWMVDVLVPLVAATESNTTAANMICRKPQEMRGVSFVQLYNASKSLQCSEYENVVEAPGPDMAILLGVMIGIFVTFPIVLVLVLLWRKGYFARCRSGKMESSSNDEETDAF